MWVIIIGGGVVGFFVVIRCVELNFIVKVIILERGKDVLGKVKIFGGGCCNVIYVCYIFWEFIKYYFRGFKELFGLFNCFVCGDI